MIMKILLTLSGLFEFIYLTYWTLDLISAAVDTAGLTITILFLCILARNLAATTLLMYQ